ncbi:heteromeric transposase endonuclease subunit TnsA [Alkalihalobacterium bogoriense]|uniref:heteromeric transposase endonuclease subunit TnsA n=1 Tax=Alkalihalobacterium bogoriense TaxID=246272 RepID=UPI000688F354|nr:heteromeric transposase endonuclease subunit TnsA [Alkalihalobacterium bogoriense]
MNISPYYESNSKVKKYLKEGRGQGIGKEYIPWTKTYSQEFSSKGRATRTFGLKTGRTHHLQSDNQYRAFLIFEHCTKVVDIRESYPLLDVMEVIDDKDDLRFDKFCDKETKEPYVITTNFLLTVKKSEGNEEYVARTIKNSSELKRNITWEKLEIERRYWLNKKVDWKIVTEKQLSRQLAKNIEWIRETMLSDNEKHSDKDQLSVLFFRYLMENDHIPLKEVTKKFEKQESLQRGLGLFLFRYLLAKKEVVIDLTQSIDFSKSIKDLMV